MQITLDITEDQVQVTLPGDLGSMTIGAQLKTEDADVLLSASERHVTAVLESGSNADQVIRLRLNWDHEPDYMRRVFEALVAGRTLADAQIPAGVFAAVSETAGVVVRVLEALGYHFGQVLPKKKAPAKARHRFDRKLADRPFTVKRNGAHATVFWRKAKEMEIAAGATLTMTPIMNQDGSERYGTKYGEKLRSDHAAAIKDGRTTAPIVLRSVNEVGLFLYYGDTNGWLELVDADGRTLDELTVVR